MTCSQCRIRKAAAAVGVCTVCLAGLGVPGTPHHRGPAPVMATVAAARPAGWPGHDEPPHGPELEAVQLAGPDLEAIDRHVLVLDDPVHGQLDGRHHLGYCETCPAALEGRICTGPCPGADQAAAIASQVG